MYNILKNVINRKAYSLTEMLTKIDTLWSENKMSDAERDELITLARDNATSEHSVDIVAKLVELEQRIKELEENKADTNTAETIEEYVVGKWYYRGNKILFNNGKVYECTAPEGVVCTWSPAEYPAYWRQIN